MQINVATPSSLAAIENLVVLVDSQSGPLLGSFARDAASLGERLREAGDFKAKIGETLFLYEGENSDLRRTLLVGLGETEKRGSSTWRRAAAGVSKALVARNIKSATLVLPAGADIASLAAGLLLSGYKYDRFISESKGKARHLDAITLVPVDPDEADTIAATVERTQAHAQGTLQARDLLCAPASHVTPRSLAETAESLAAAAPERIHCRVLDEAELAAEGCGALLAVGRGSEQESLMIVLDHHPATAEKTVVLVGKGVTFDSGGISLKPVEKMDEMKYDMGGAAAVLGVFRALGELELPWRIVGLVPCVENMPGERAFRPGDILESRSGLSIEIKTTDAEGRLILADALDYAKEFSPDLLIDLATLTGSCLVALGHECAGMMSNAAGAQVAQALQASGDRVGERVWPLPMFDEYAELIKSDFADLKNSGGRYGGAILAGKFLQRFADHAPWVHLDIAGTAWTGKERDLTPKVGNGFGVRLLLDFLENYAG